MYPAETYSIALGYFPQLLGLVYLLAFGSLLVQVQGLYCSQGILPMHELVTDLRRKSGPRSILRFPSIFWFNTSDAFITASAVAGVCLSLYLLAGLPGPTGHNCCNNGTLTVLLVITGFDILNVWQFKIS